MSASRRQFLRGGVATAAGLVAARAALGAPQQPEHQHQAPPVPPASQGAQPAAPPAPVVEPAGERRTGFVPVATPDLAKLPYRLEDGVKVFHLTCDVVRQSFVPWREPFNTWGYNGSTPGPAIETIRLPSFRPSSPLSRTPASGSAGTSQIQFATVSLASC